MLNRVKHNLILAFTGLLLALPAFAIDSTVTYININDRAYQDIEIALTDKSEILVPFKQFADLFNIQYKANRVDKQIDFTTYDNKKGTLNLNGVFVEDSPISKEKPVFIQQGIMDGVINEAYITAKTASKIFGAKIETDYENLIILAKVIRDIPILQTNNILDDPKAPRAFEDIVMPKKPGKITLNTIGLRSNMMNNNMSIRGANYSNNNNTFNGSTQGSLNGNFWGGKYKIEASEYHYRSDAFMFGGVSGSYKNSIKDEKTGQEVAWYQLGNIRGFDGDDIQIGSGTFGGQIWSYDYEKEPPSRLSGYVKPASLVRLTVNDLEPTTISTYAGYYSLRGVQLPNPVKYIKLEEVNEDGTIDLIKEVRYSVYGNKPLENEHRGSAYTGIWGHQNRFFREGQNIYRGSNKKVAAGINHQYGIKDNVTLDTRVTGDRIYENGSEVLLYKIPTNDTLLVSGTQKSVNYIDGVSALSSLEYVNPKNKNLKARLIAGTSVAHDIREEHTHAGYMVKTSGEYEKDLTKFEKKLFKPKQFKTKVDIFHSSPDFYLAGSDGTSKNDRTGAKVSGNIHVNQTNAGGSYSRYYSNFNHRYKGGTIKFDEASISAATRIPKVADVRFGSSFKRGENELGRNKNYFYDGNVSRVFWGGVKLQGGRRESYYDTRYHEPGIENRNYHSKYADNYAQLDIPIPHNYGQFTLGHNVIRYDSGNYKNGYNMFRFGYTFPTWKRLSLGVGYGFKYYGQGGNDFNVNLGYRAKSGQTMSVGYSYSENGGYFIDNMFTPSTSRHTVTFSFNDAFQLFHNGLKSVGTEDINKGIFEAIAFVDVNKNGKYDKKIDVPVQDVSLLTSWSSQYNITNKRGRVYSQVLDDGVYTVSLDMNTLPITVAPVTNDLIKKQIKINGGQTTLLEIPLASTVGSVSGTLKIFDDFERGLRITDFVVVLYDENGEEVNYSTVGSDGDFYISGLAPGNYTVKLDERFIDAYGLEELPEKSEISIQIPYDYKNPIDFSDLNLEYKTYAL